MLSLCRVCASTQCTSADYRWAATGRMHRRRASSLLLPASRHPCHANQTLARLSLTLTLPQSPLMSPRLRTTPTARLQCWMWIRNGGTAGAPARAICATPCSGPLPSLGAASTAQTAWHPRPTSTARSTGWHRCAQLQRGRAGMHNEGAVGLAAGRGRPCCTADDSGPTQTGWLWFGVHHRKLRTHMHAESMLRTSVCVRGTQCGRRL